MVAKKAQIHLRLHTLIPEMKPLAVHYSKQVNKAEIRSVTPENVKKYLEIMGLDYSKYNICKAQEHR